MNYFKYLFLSAVLFNLSCVGQVPEKEPSRIKTGAEQTEKYLKHIEGKKIAVVANHTTNINGSHLVDSLLNIGVEIVKIFSPEHGFRGDAEAGEIIKSYIDEKTQLPVISLYGDSKEPKLSDFEDIDILIFDLQDVGARFYTYISNMHYVMEACAETNVEMLILDRPNPNGYYVDGPILDTNYQSFVGMHPVPIVHGMTIGEFAQMINGEKWLKNNLECNLSVIPCANYTHDSLYKLPLNPSPNLQNMLSIYLYPSLGFFEGTYLSEGRGTDYPFQVFGAPDLKNAEFIFTPKSIDGVSKYPKHKDQKCFGIDLRGINVDELILKKEINLEWILFAYNNIEDKGHFFNSFFYNISGTNQLKEQIIEGKTEEEIKLSWQSGLREFKKIRKKYLIYKDFE